MKLKKQLIERYFRGESAPEERQQVREWFASDEGQLFLKQRMSQQINDNSEILIDHAAPDERMRQHIEARLPLQRKTLWPRIARVAAVLIPILLVSSYFIFRSVPVADDVVAKIINTYVPKAQRQQVVLSDGTIVWLNADSRLQYPDRFTGNERRVTLSGEAFFEVAKDTARSFRVELTGMDIVVTGTEFNVKAYPEDKEILTYLNEGSIDIYNKVLADAQAQSVKPGQLVTFTKADGVCTIASSDGTEDYFAWTSGNLVFKNTHLQDMLCVLERHFGKTFVITNRQLYKYTYHIRFEQDASLEKIINRLELITPVHFVDKGEGYEIYLRKEKKKY
ncbi:MAG: FecR domain-containing protein [Dysgonamonadaceae bacterium]|jgi:ferric-dicitrate binding protein FerR (iron transport regulator)|nr:FecR domain-containing protein [Dysgonamonadaceae bacterium]